MKRAIALFPIAGLVLCIGMAACSKSSNSAPAKPTLYDSLGGTAMVSDPAHPGTMIEKGRLGIRSVVDSAIFVIAADSKLNPYFTTLLSEIQMGNTSGFMALSKNLTDFVCVGTGAKDFSYTGKNMVDAHDPAKNSRISMKVDNTDFTQFEVDLGVAANKNGLPENLTASVAAVVESLRSQVVQR